MEDASRMLTQEEIDAMVSQTAIKPAPAHKINSTSAASIARMAAGGSEASPDVRQMPLPKHRPAAPEAMPAGGSGHYECIAAGEISSLHECLAELTGRISRLELMVSKLDSTNKSSAPQVNPATVKAALQQIQNVSSQVEVISEGLRGTAGYNINKIFSCSSCGSVGMVAVKVKCTKCGQENWWGWWPKKK